MGSAHYEQIADEISSGNIDRGLWVEAFATSLGDERATRAQYIKLRMRKLRSLGIARSSRAIPGNEPASAGQGCGVVGWLVQAVCNAAEDLWTAWLWLCTFVFAVVTAVGLLGLGTLCYLKLYDESILAWVFFTVGGAFVTFFLFGRGVHALLCRPPTSLFYGVELGALCAALWPFSHLMNPAVFRHVPPALSTEMVFLTARFLNSGDTMTNALSAAVFLLPVYGVIAFLRQQKI